MQRFTSHSLYRYVGSKDAPAGFERSPSLVDYLNYLAGSGLRVFSVVSSTDQMWYTILTVEEVTQ